MLGDIFCRKEIKEDYMSLAKYRNGDLLRDKVTGLEGVVLVVAFYSTGCIHYGIQPQGMKDSGEPKEWTWLDESRLEMVKPAAVKLVYEERRSGNMPTGPRVG